MLKGQGIRVKGVPKLPKIAPKGPVTNKSD